MIAQPVLPPAAKVFKATMIALGVALVLLFTAILPAEYGIDPLRTGKLFPCGSPGLYFPTFSAIAFEV